MKPAGSWSKSTTLVAVAEPVLVYCSVTVMLPVEGDGPLATDSDFTTLITALPVTVAVSVFVPAAAGEFDASPALPVVLTVIVSDPVITAPGHCAAITNRNTPPAGTDPEVVIAVALSGTPSPFASA